MITWQKVRQIKQCALEQPCDSQERIRPYQHVINQRLTLTHFIDAQTGVKYLSLATKDTVDENELDFVQRNFDIPKGAALETFFSNDYHIWRFTWPSVLDPRDFRGTTPIDLAYQDRYDCGNCPSRCDSHSKAAYIFRDDVELSERAEDWLLERLKLVLGLDIRKTPAQAHGLPDLEILHENQVIARVEVKAQGRAFMKIERLLPTADLKPYETVALNLSDLRRYIEIYGQEQIPSFIIWRVRRPCLGEGYWGQSVGELGRIYQRYNNRRRFRRKSTPSDYVDGEHKGVTVNYHFSLRELEPLEVVESTLHKACAL